MKVYLAVSARPGAAIPDLDAITPAITKVVFPSRAGTWHRRAWKSRDGATHLIGWSNEPDEEDVRYPPLLQTDRDAAVGYPGYLGAGTPIRRPLEAGRLGEIDGWSGVFGVFRADQEGIHALTTACRLHPVYHGTAGGLAVAGNRALLVHTVLRAAEAGPTARQSYDVGALEALIRVGHFLDEDTPFEGVKALPAHSTLHSVHGTETVTVRSFPGGSQRAGAMREQLDELAAALTSAARPLGEFPELTSSTLTGGRDSRLVAASLRAAGVPFRTFTSGFPDHPDVVLASRVAGLLVVPHQSRAPRRDASGEALVVPHPLARTWQLLRSTEGMISAFYNVQPLAPFSTSPKLCGSGGEQLRGGYMTKLRAIDDATARATLRKLLLAGDDTMTEAANQRATERLRRWQQRPPFEALDLLYLYDRSGRWSAPARAATRFRHTTFDILFDNRVTRGALAIPSTARWTERPLFELIARLAPVLRDVPLIGRRWTFDIEEPRWGRRRAWRAREPVPAPDARSSGFDWRDTMVTPSAGPHFREQILDGPAQVFEVVDRARIEAALARPTVGHARVKLLWGAYTASVLLSGEWLKRRPVLDDVHIALPAGTRRAVS